MTDKPELTLQDAEAIVNALSIDQTEWRKWSDRSDGERLAIGVVVLQKHMRGKSLRQIEAEMGIPYSTVQRYKERALMAIMTPTVDAARKEELERLDTLITAVWPAAESGDDKAINTYLRLAERRAKLLGLDKPIQVESTVLEVTAAERELQDMIRQVEIEDAGKLRELTNEQPDN